MPTLSTANLEALRDALRGDDVRLTQGSTTTPPPLMAVQDWPCEAGCLLAFMGVTESGGFACSAEDYAAFRLGAPHRSNPDAATVKQAEEFFARKCWEADQRLGEPAACKHLLNWYDATPREEMRNGLLAEVELALRERMTAKEPQPC